MRIISAKKLCKRLSAQYGIVNAPDVIPLKYSRTGKSVILGYYNNDQNTIEINKYALELWNNADIRELINHELMHARCYQDFGHGGHGPRFKLLCKMCGITGDAKNAVSKKVH